MRFCIVLFTLLVTLGCSVSAIACWVAPRHIYLKHREAITDADWIAWVRPIEIDRTTYFPTYKLEVIERIKGSAPKVIEIAGQDLREAMGHNSYPSEGNYYGHRASSFWTKGGRSHNEPDCKIHPSFIFGGSEYLIFGPKDYNVGYENIVENGDLWLEFVRETITSGEDVALPFPVNPISYFQSAEAVVRLSGEWIDGRVNLETSVLRGEMLPYAEMLHVDPHAAFASFSNSKCEFTDYYPIRRRGNRIEKLIVFEFLPKEDIYFKDDVYCVGGRRDGYADIMAWGLFSTTGHQEFGIDENGGIYYPSGPSPVRNYNDSSEKKITLEQIEAILASDQ